MADGGDAVPEGWWRASDGKVYPAAQLPAGWMIDASGKAVRSPVAPPPPAPPQAAPAWPAPVALTDAGPARRPGRRRVAFVAVGLVAAIGGVAAVAASGGDDPKTRTFVEVPAAGVNPAAVASSTTVAVAPVPTNPPPTAAPTPLVTQPPPTAPASTRAVAPVPTNPPPTAAPATARPAATQPPATAAPAVSYKNCDAVRAAGKAPIRRGDPGYGSHLDRDNDGIGCE